MSHDSIAKTIFPGFQWKIQNILYFKKNNQLIQNNFSKLFSGKWTVLSINIIGKKIWGMGIKFMSHDSIAKSIFPRFQWKIQNIMYFKKNNQLIQNNFSKLFSGKWTVLGINIMEKKYVEWNLSLWVMMASQRQYSLDFSEKFKIYCILKRITSLYKIILVNYFHVNGRSLG